MKLILRLLFGKPKKANRPKKEKKSPISLKWNEDLWKPNSQ